MISPSLTPDLLLSAYRAGLFPMAEDASANELYWFDPPERTIFPLDKFHIPTRLRRTIRRQPYRLTLNQAFPEVMRGCAAPQPTQDRAKTWINAEIIALYTALHRMGHAHSIEAWQDDSLAGGLYGVQIGGAFFGESMFSVMTDASKICLAALAALLRRQGFALLDCQFMTPHLRRFGAVTIGRDEYRQRLAEACALHCRLPVLSSMGGTYPGTGTGKDSDGGAFSAGSGDAVLSAALMVFLQEITQIS